MRKSDFDVGILISFLSLEKWTWRTKEGHSKRQWMIVDGSSNQYQNTINVVQIKAKVKSVKSPKWNQGSAHIKYTIVWPRNFDGQRLLKFSSWTQNRWNEGKLEAVHTSFGNFRGYIYYTFWIFCSIWWRMDWRTIE